MLFSPIAAEKHTDPNFPDPGPLNQNLKLYSDAMAETARSYGVPFVDLMAPSAAAYAKAKEPLTVNGVHLTDEGYRALAPAMFETLLGKRAPLMNGEAFEKLRAAVNQKSSIWHSRYRTVDGYNVYGGRSHLKFNGVPNRDMMQREMEMRDVMTANRDKRIWAVAQGKDLEVRDDNLPQPVEVTTNKPGPKPDETFPFLSGEEAIKHMKIPPGLQGEAVRQRGAVPRAGQPGADGVGHARAGCGSRRGRTIRSARPTARRATACSSSKTPTATARPTSARRSSTT